MRNRSITRQQFEAIVNAAASRHRLEGRALTSFMAWASRWQHEVLSQSVYRYAFKTMANNAAARFAWENR